MKKIVASVGLVALGASGLDLVCAQTAPPQDTSKPWAVSATLRGFYDDNVNSIPDNQTVTSGQHRDSFGFEVSPSVGLGFNWEQTRLSLGYTYSLLYFIDKPAGNLSHDDQSHTFNAALDHAFTERYRLSVRDSFVIGQEPDLLRAGSTFATFQRVPGDNIRNYGSIKFDADLTRQFGLQAGYDNALYDYADEGDGSLSARLDRIEHNAHLDARWKLQPETIALVGYAYSQVDFTDNHALGFDIFGNPSGSSKDRNSRSHYLYVGGDHSFTPDLSASVRAGARILDFYNANESTVSPYAMGSLRWIYGPESYVEGGFSYDRTATDIAMFGDSLTLDADTSTVFATVNHRFTPRWHGSFTGQFQNQTFNGGAANNKSEQIYLAGLQLEYYFNPNFSAQVGYNYDRLESDLGRTFDRNRVYMGVTARY